MGAPIELKFHINAYSKATFPLVRLGQYLTELGVLLGERANVHFDRLEDGSAVPVAMVDAEAAPKVLQRAHAVRCGEGPADARRAKDKIERLLVEDNAQTADLNQTGGARILQFKGREGIQEAYGPVRQYGELTGTVIMVGGKNDPVSVHLEDGDRTHHCEAKRDLAKRLAAHLFASPVRAVGYGRWSRTDEGVWQMDDFKVAEFSVLDATPLSGIIRDLRSVRSEWLSSDDPLGRLADSRKG